MKKLFLLAFLSLASCSPETENPTNEPDCDCDRVVEVSTFNVVGTPQNPAINYHSVYITINDCTNVQRQKTFTTTNINQVPVVGQCR